MPKICEKCKKEFPIKIEINGKIRNTQRRRFCFECSPFGLHNTSKNPIEQEVDLACERESRYKNRRKGYNIKRKKEVLESRQKTKKELVLYKGGECEICGYNKPFMGAFAFHHKDPSEKELKISDFLYMGFEKLKKEADKCSLLCVRCHAEVHDFVPKNE